jgi:hypothetical protein
MAQLIQLIYIHIYSMTTRLQCLKHKTNISLLPLQEIFTCVFELSQLRPPRFPDVAIFLQKSCQLFPLFTLLQDFQCVFPLDWLVYLRCSMVLLLHIYL